MLPPKQGTVGNAPKLCVSSRVHLVVPSVGTPTQLSCRPHSAKLRLALRLFACARLAASRSTLPLAHSATFGQRVACLVSCAATPTGHRELTLCSAAITATRRCGRTSVTSAATSFAPLHLDALLVQALLVCVSLASTTDSAGSASRATMPLLLPTPATLAGLAGSLVVPDIQAIPTVLRVCELERQLPPRAPKPRQSCVKRRQSTLPHVSVCNTCLGCTLLLLGILYHRTIALQLHCRVSTAACASPMYNSMAYPDTWRRRMK